MKLAPKSLLFASFGAAPAEPYKPYAAEGRNRPAACSLRCLTFFSETRNWLPKACHLLVSGLAPPRALAPCGWRTEPARRSFLNDQETSFQKLAICLFRGWPRRALAPWCWRTARGLQLTVPNVDLWTAKKLAPKSLLFASFGAAPLEPYKPHAAEGRNRPAACSLRC